MELIVLFLMKGRNVRVETVRDLDVGNWEDSKTNPHNDVFRNAEDITNLKKNIIV